VVCPRTYVPSYGGCRAGETDEAGGAAVKGDRVEIEVDTGDGTRTYEVAATRAGRRVEVSTGRGIVEVSEVTRTGTAVRTARFMASRVVALVEHPALGDMERG
jgi:hypothetical protein